MQIPEYTRGIIKPREQASTVDLSAIYTASDTANAMAQVADVAAKKLFDIDAKYKEAADTVALNDMVIQSKKQKIKLLDERRADPNLDYMGFADTFDADLKKIDDDAVNNAKVSDRVKQEYKKSAAQFNLSAYDENIGWQRKKTVEKLDGSIKRSQADLEQLAYRSSLLGESLDSYYKDADALAVAGSQVYSSEEVDYLHRQTYQKIQEAELKAKLDSDPEGLLRETTVGKYAAGDIDFNTAVEHVLKSEGGFVANDGGKGETLYGINSAANPKEYAEIKALNDAGSVQAAQDKAKQVYKTKYWDAIGADKLDPRLAMVAFDAADSIKQANDPLKVDVRAIREKEVKTLLKDKTSKVVLDEFGAGVFTFNPSYMGSENEAQIFADYRKIYEESYLRYGNPDAAHSAAMAAIKTTSGETNVTGEKMLMQYPPEMYYGLPDLTPEENSQWIAEELKADLTAVGLPTDKIALIPAVNSRGRIDKGQPPLYHVFVEQEVDGFPVLDLARDGKNQPLTLSFDTQKQMEKVKADRAKESEIAKLQREARVIQQPSGLLGWLSSQVMDYNIRRNINDPQFVENVRAGR